MGTYTYQRALNKYVEVYLVDRRLPEAKRRLLVWLKHDPDRLRQELRRMWPSIEYRTREQCRREGLPVFAFETQPTEAIEEIVQHLQTVFACELDAL